VQTKAGNNNAWDVFSRWVDEPWGATLQPTVVYSGLDEEYVDALINME